LAQSSVRQGTDDDGITPHQQQQQRQQQHKTKGLITTRKQAQTLPIE
jgi:hypothetical protein